MKTLVELLHDEMVRSGYFGVNGRDNEAIAGLVGAVQEWLTSELSAMSDPEPMGAVQDLIHEAGRGLDA